LKELSIIREGEHPLLYRERKQYLQGPHHARSGVEAAQVILARAAQWLDSVKQGGQLPKRK
jgi:hypothetical protein